MERIDSGSVFPFKIKPATKKWLGSLVKATMENPIYEAQEGWTQ